VTIKKKDQLFPNSNVNNTQGVRKIILSGIFRRILIIDIIIVVCSISYLILIANLSTSDLFRYSLIMVFFFGIVLFFAMATLKRFLDKNIISPLEYVASDNRRLINNDPDKRNKTLSDNAPQEIKNIVLSCSKMLGTTEKVSEARLQMVNFIRETFGRYLSSQIVDQILESPDGLKIGGKRETVTILMSDLRGFTTLSETKDPEEMVILLNRYLKRMSEIIITYDGIIDEFIGDAILAIFGITEKHEDHAAKAVACGLEMQNALVKLNKEIEKQGYPHLEMGIGINTGDVIVGNIGSEIRMKFGVVGSPVNIASRIESNTIGGQVLLGESTYRMVMGSVTVDPPSTVMMKGLKKPLVSYPVEAITSPYNIALLSKPDIKTGLSIHLPFHCWEVEDKKIKSIAIWGETITIKENLIEARLQFPIKPLTNIKMTFDFCVDAHCFDEIYAKVVSVDTNENQTVSLMGITSISQKDKNILKKWAQEAS
jgi:class 3 adenylate cyclase